MSLSRFTRQTEVMSVIDTYIDAHLGELPEFPDQMRIISGTDGAAVFFASPDAVLANNVYTDPLRISLADRILDCAAYYLAQGVPLEDAPENLRICMPVNHLNVHWTGVVASLPSFRDLLQRALEAGVDLGNGNIQRTRRQIEKLLFEFKFEYTNEEREQIEKEFGFPNLGEDSQYDDAQVEKITEKFRYQRRDSNDHRASIVLSHFPALRLFHLDSLNYGHLQRVQEGFGEVGSRVKEVRCAQQSGNTCGDNTALNLFAMGVYQTVPTDRMSKKLRKLTNAIPRSEADAAIFGDLPEDENYSKKSPAELKTTAKKILSRIIPVGEEKAAFHEKESTFDPVATLNEFIHDVSKRISGIDAIAGDDTLDLMQAVIVSDNTGIHLNVEALAAATERYNTQTLNTLFGALLKALSGEHALTQNLEKEDRIVFGNMAQVFLSDTCLEMERNQLLSIPELDVVFPDAGDAPQEPAEEKASQGPAEEKGVSHRSSGIFWASGGGLAAVGAGLLALAIALPSLVVPFAIGCAVAWVASAVLLGMAWAGKVLSGGGASRLDNTAWKSTQADVHSRLNTRPSPKSDSTPTPGAEVDRPSSQPVSQKPKVTPVSDKKAKSEPTQRRGRGQ